MYVDTTFLTVVGVAGCVLIALCFLLDFARLACCRWPRCVWFASRWEQLCSFRDVDRCLRVTELRWALHGIYMCCRTPRKVVYRVLPIESPSELALTDSEIREAFRALSEVDKQAAPPPARIDIYLLQTAIQRAIDAHVSTEKLEKGRRRLMTALKYQGRTPTAVQVKLLTVVPDELLNEKYKDQKARLAKDDDTNKGCTTDPPGRTLDKNVGRRRMERSANRARGFWADRHRLRGDRHLLLYRPLELPAAAAASITADLPAATAASNLSTLTAARTADGTAATRHLSITATPAIATAHTASRTALSTIQPPWPPTFLPPKPFDFKWTAPVPLAVELYYYSSASMVVLSMLLRAACMRPIVSRCARRITSPPTQPSQRTPYLQAG